MDVTLVISTKEVTVTYLECKTHLREDKLVSFVGTSIQSRQDGDSSFAVQFISVIGNTEVIVDGNRRERSIEQIVTWVSDLLKLVVQVLVVFRYQFFEQTVSLTEKPSKSAWVVAVNRAQGTSA